MDRPHRIRRRASPNVGEATGLVTQKLYADGQGPCYTYTDDGNLATRTWARGVTTSYTYDAWGSLTSTTYSDGTPVATRPLYWQPRTSQGNFSLFYTHDGNKNVSEAVFYQRARGVAAHDEYAPFGEVTAQTRGNAWGTLDLAADNPWRFSCEYADDASATVYYNYRHYEPLTGRWTSRDPMMERGGVNSYVFCGNNSVCHLDRIGQKIYSAWETYGCSEIDVDEAAREVLKMAVKLMLDPKNHYEIDGVYERVEYYGSICCDAKKKTISYTEPVRGFADTKVLYSAFKCVSGGGFQPHSYPKDDPRARCPKGTCVVAYYHTHPYSPRFSDEDKKYIRAESTAYYMSNGKCFRRIVPHRDDREVTIDLGGTTAKMSHRPVDPVDTELGLDVPAQKEMR